MLRRSLVGGTAKSNTNGVYSPVPLKSPADEFRISIVSVEPGRARLFLPFRSRLL